jgi:hypothetical protein
MICAVNHRHEFRERARLLARHARQLAPLTDDDVQRRADKIAVTFRPGDRTASFYNNTLRPAGAAVAVVLSYDEQGREITLGGFRAVESSDGHLRYGGNRRPEFQYDVRPRPARSDSRSRLWADRNPSLVELALRMDHVTAQRTSGSLPTVPTMPRIRLGFAPSQLPEFLPTAALHRTSAEQAGISLQKLASNPPELVERLLRQTWDGLLSDPAAFDPQGGLFLIDAEFCHSKHRPLRVFEDFQHLIGDWTWNPVRGLHVESAPNDVEARLAVLGVSVEGIERIPQTTLDNFLSQWRGDLGERGGLFADEDFFDAILSPGEPLVACSAVIPTMRKRLTAYWNETATDFDLRRAAKYPHDALFASGACRVQVLARRAVAHPLKFASDDLGRRIDADWRPIMWPSKTEQSEINPLIAA